MTDRGIIFAAPMVSALRENRKTQTRRLGTSPLRRCVPGDRLWVREAWSGIFWDPKNIDGPARELWETPRIERTSDLSSGVFYKLDEEAKSPDLRFVPEGQWTPSIHMPRWASRLTLIIEGVKVEPLQAISAEDAIAEGIERGADGWRTYDEGPRAFGPRESYASLWASLHTDDGQRWQDNPNVVALTFSVVRGNIDQVPA